MAQKPPITIKHTQTVTKTINPRKRGESSFQIAVLLVSNVPSFQQEKQTYKPKSIVYIKKQESLTLSKKKVNQ